MIKLVLKIILITIIILGVSYLSSSIFLKKELLRAHNMYLLEDENDILFVGSSHVFTAVDVNYLENKTNANVFLLATPSQNISQSYYLIKEFLKHKKPKLLFLETYSLKEYVGDDFVSHSAYDGIKLSKTKIEAAYDASFHDSINDLYTFSSLIIPLFKYHNRWNGDLTKQDFEYFDNTVLNKGSEIPTANSEFTPTDLEFIDYNLSKINEKTVLNPDIESKLKAIIQLCAQNNIKLVLFSTPYLAHHGYSVGNQIKNINYLKSIIKNDHVKYLDFNLLYKEIDISYSDYIDSHHLNYNGAKKVNAYLGEWIIKNHKIDLPNRESEQLWYKYFDKKLTNEVVFEKETQFSTHDSLYIEKIILLKKDDKSYIIVDLNDDLNIEKFNDQVSSDVLRMMAHFYPDEKDVDKIISKEEFINQDFKPTIMDFKGNKFLFSKLENKTSSEISFYKFANFTFYTASKGRGNVLTLFDLKI